MPAPPQPDPIDAHVGALIRGRRLQLGVSQEQLANALGVTYGQVQKYEAGANRVSASKLHRIAGRLRVGVAFFFEGLPTAPVDPRVPIFCGGLDEFLAAPGAGAIIAGFPALPPMLRSQIVDLIDATVAVCGRTGPR